MGPSARWRGVVVVGHDGGRSGASPNELRITPTNVAGLH